MIRPLHPGDAPAALTLLRQHRDSSLFLIGNLLDAAGGLVDEGLPKQGAYLGEWRGDALVGIVAWFWNGMIMLQAGDHTGALVRALRARSARPDALIGLLGPHAQTEEAKRALGLDEATLKLDSREVLYGLDLDALRTPSVLDSGEVVVRRARRAELDALIAMRVAYFAEQEHREVDDALRARALRSMRDRLTDGWLWVAERGGAVAAMCSFNAVVQDEGARIAQVGGVFTAPAHRRLHLGRAVVAGALRDARGEGFTRSVLFTGEHNAPARRAYAALGYEEVGAFGLVLLA